MSETLPLSKIKLIHNTEELNISIIIKYGIYDEGGCYILPNIIN